jgi:signal transduction histidine kinase
VIWSPSCSVGLTFGQSDIVFNPLFTKKARGMGMGLSICRAIIEAHEERLWAVPDRSQGAAFQFTLRADTALSADLADGSSNASIARR